MNPTYFTFQEIMGQAAAWKATLEEVSGKAAELRALLSRGAYQRALFIGCGSTYNVSLSAARTFQGLTGLDARGLPSSEVFLFPQLWLSHARRTLLVAISRSGETTETLRAVEYFRQEWGQDVVTITCDGGSTLPTLGTLTLLTQGAREKSIAQTRSFSSMLIASQVMAAIAAGRDDLLQAMQGLPALGDDLMARHQGLAKQMGEDSSIQRFNFLGSGPNYGLACEGMLKCMEMSLSSSASFHFLEFRHGPISMADGVTLIVALASDFAFEEEAAVLWQAQELGAKILLIAEDGDRLGSGHPDCAVYLHSGLPDVARGVLYLPMMQLMAYYRALAKGLNPDKPANLDFAVKLRLR